jgi:hypothetical protein
MNVEELMEWELAGELKFPEEIGLPHDLTSNRFDLRSGKPATNRQSSGTAWFSYRKSLLANVNTGFEIWER